MRTHTNNRTGRGFTLMEVLIVVMILGVLAAIVITQFKSSSHEARIVNLQSQLQIVRNQIAVHDVANPAHRYSLSTPVASFWDSPNGSAPGLIPGDFLQSYPKNPLQGNSTVVSDAPGSGTGWVWGETVVGDASTLNVYAVDATGGWFDGDSDGIPD